MLIRPNQTIQSSISFKKNDLYRKFRDYFIGATEKEFQQFDAYGIDGYVSVNTMVEERIFDTLGHSINEILPITGATGIGKTYLLLYCLKRYYEQNDIATNNPQLFYKKNGYDLVYYSDFTIVEESILKDPSRLILAKIKAMYECIRNRFSVSEPDIQAYIDNNKLEVNFYSKMNKDLEIALFKLTVLLGLDNVKINNIVFVFDDLESLSEKQQFTLMDKFLTLYENFKSKSNRKFYSKFIFSLRSSTYYNIYQQDFFNTHRASKASYLTLTPSLSDIFKKRFDIILKSEKVEQAKNRNTWEKAKSILVSIAKRIDSSYANLLLRLNNNNISNALEDFLNILSNRRWTQKNANITASFSIAKEDYYINDANILRILSMGEENVFYQSKALSLRCIFPNPGVSLRNDFIALLVLRAFRFSIIDSSKDPSIMALLSVEECANKITNIIYSLDDKDYKKKKDNIKAVVQESFDYYEKNRFIRKNINPEVQCEPENIKYFMLPRGEQTFDMFFSQTILFTIFRDTFLWNDNVFNVKCSDQLSYNDLMVEATQYECFLINIEKELFQKITENNTWREYVSTFGEWSFSQNFMKAINTSIQQYYKDNDIVILDGVTDRLINYQQSIEELVEAFDSIRDDGTFF